MTRVGCMRKEPPGWSLTKTAEYQNIDSTAMPQVDKHCLRKTTSQTVVKFGFCSLGIVWQFRWQHAQHCMFDLSLSTALTLQRDSRYGIAEQWQCSLNKVCDSEGSGTIVMTKEKQPFYRDTQQYSTPPVHSDAFFVCKKNKESSLFEDLV